MKIPPKVDDQYKYWQDQPPEQSARCDYWVEKIKSGWKPNNRIRTLGYSGRTEFFGVYVWEYLNILYPLLRGNDA